VLPDGVTLYRGMVRYHANVALSSINVPEPQDSIFDAWPVLARDRLIFISYQYNVIFRGRTAIGSRPLDLRHAAVAVSRSVT
jgi:hypothetical protein